MIEILLRRRDGSVRAVARIDDEDAHLTAYTWHLSTDGYAVRNPLRLAGEKVHRSLHRSILGLEHGDEMHVDHIDGDGLNNTRANLRLVTRSGNMQNRRPHRGGSSRYRGVGLVKPSGRWQAYASVNGKHRTLGTFATEEEAAMAASEFRRLHMPFTNEERSLREAELSIPRSSRESSDA